MENQRDIGMFVKGVLCCAIVLFLSMWVRDYFPYAQASHARSSVCEDRKQVDNEEDEKDSPKKRVEKMCSIDSSHPICLVFNDDMKDEERAQKVCQQHPDEEVCKKFSKATDETRLDVAWAVMKCFSPPDDFSGGTEYAAGHSECPLPYWFLPTITGILPSSKPTSEIAKPITTLLRENVREEIKKLSGECVQLFNKRLILPRRCYLL